MKKNYFIFFLGILFVMLGFVSESTFFINNDNQRGINNFQTIFIQKQNAFNALINDIAEKIKQKGLDNFLTEDGIHYSAFLAEKGFSVQVFKNDTLVYWSDNATPTPSGFAESYTDTLINTGNAWCYLTVSKENGYTFFGYIVIETDYFYQNKFLKSIFHPSFLLPDGVYDISTEKSPIAIKDAQNRNAFYITQRENTSYNAGNHIFPSILYFLALLCFLILPSRLLTFVRSSSLKTILLLSLAILLLLLKHFMSKLEFPGAWYHLELFNPMLFAVSNLLPSLGDLLVGSIFLYTFFYNFYKHLSIAHSFSTGKKISTFLIHILLLAAVVAFFILIHFLFKSMILNSSISFEAQNILEISIYTFIGIFIISLLFAAFSLFNYKIAQICFPYFSFKKALILFVMVAIATYFIYYAISKEFDYISLIFLIAYFSLVLYIIGRENLIKQYSSFIFIAFFFSIFSVYIINRYSLEKEKEHMKVLALNLSSEHDPVAELLFEDFDEKISTDSVLANMLIKEKYTYNEVYNYIRKKYFNGYWTKYDFQLTICSHNDDVFIEPDMVQHHCFTFFTEMINKLGYKLPNSSFYFLENDNGRVSYFSVIKPPLIEGKSNLKLFLQLDSRLVSEELGYPELLLNENLIKKTNGDYYSYAKYHNSKLIAQSGNFSYNLTDNEYHNDTTEFILLRSSGKIHLIYNEDANNTIILSRHSLTFSDVLISFSYIFVLFFAVITLALLIYNPSVIKKSLRLNFKNRIQFSMIAILLLSLLLVGSGTINYSIQQYKKKHNELLSEKIQSVYMELIHQFEFEERISPTWHSQGFDNLDELLKKFSNIFYSDINLYDTQGKLLATSRPELFEKGLSGKLMNPEAYIMLGNFKRAEFIHNEKIGNLNYISAYLPVLNNQNKLLAYLNLPYFTRQNTLTREISTLIVAFVNVYVILMLISIFITVFIANKITYPLRLLQRKFSEIELGKKQELVEYTGNDEIGSLVNEYNKMVIALAQNVELLAQSEREMAWREMAKQIAHEIKNPLTPMKLSVQHLLRAWHDKVENWEDYLNRVSKTLIEEIDNLSRIATEFSNFAKIPEAKNETVDLLAVLTSVCSLFAQNPKLEVSLEVEKLSNAIIFADKEQIHRVFINLVNNALQSVRIGEIAKIKLSLKKADNKYIVEVKDNGKGIEAKIKDKLFQPNFTTKNSGMGLGLSISKSIIDSTGGKISYTTKLNTGSVFIVELPTYQKSI